MLGFATIVAAPIPSAGLSFGFGPALALTLMAVLVGAVFFIVRDAALSARGSRTHVAAAPRLRVVVQSPEIAPARRNKPPQAA
jgi:hypothetical protein